MKTIFFTIIFVLLLLIVPVTAQEIIDLNKIKTVAIPIHIVELVLAFFICFMSLKFFRITKPINLFLFLYIAVGFFVVNTLLYVLLYLSLVIPFEVRFVNVYIGSRIALVGMLASFVIFFYQWNKIMRKTDIK